MKKENRELAVISPRMMDIMEHYIGMLERENELLKNDYNIADDGIDDLNDVVKDLRKENEELKAENKRLHGINAELIDNNERFLKSYREDFEEIEKLKAEIEELKENASKYLREDASKRKVHLMTENKRLNRVNSELCEKIEGLKSSDDVRKLRINRKKYEKLQAENKELKLLSCTDDCQDNVNSLIKLKAEIKEKEEQYHMLASSNTSHYPKEYREEAEMYFHHNPNTEKLWFFMVGDSEVDEDGDIRTTLNVGVDAIAECDNLNGDVGLEVYK